jgi:hypothetical protein
MPFRPSGRNGIAVFTATPRGLHQSGDDSPAVPTSEPTQEPSPANRGDAPSA